MPWGYAAAVVGGALLSSEASKDAAGTQAGSSDKASQTQLNMFGQTQRGLEPFASSGRVSLNQLMSLLGIGGTAPGSPDYSKLVDMSSGAPSPVSTLYASDPAYKAAWDKYEAAHQEHFGSGFTPSSNPANIENFIRQQLPPTTAANAGNTPGFGALTKPFGMEDFQASPAYQFNLDQGTKAIEKAAAKRGNFYAPATLQDISKFSQGLASNEFQNAYSNYNTNMGNIWNRLYSLSAGGQNAAANQGGFGTTVGSQIGNNIIGAGNAQAAGTVGSANAFTGGANNLYNQYVMQQLLAGNQRSSVPTSGQSGSFDEQPVYA